LINDPKEVLDTLKFDYISLDVVEKMINGIMERLGFRLPERLMAPTTMFAFTNIFASKIEVKDKNVVYQFDPRSLGIMSDEVLALLTDIKHPTSEMADSDVHAYSVTFD